MEYQESYTTAIWTIVILSAVIGQFTEITSSKGDDGLEIIDEDPSFTREQAQEWSQEFFKKSRKGLSYLENLPDPPAFNIHPDAGNSRSDPLKWRNSFARTGGINYPTVKPENLEWMLRHIFSYPRSHATNETAKGITKKYIADSFQLTSGLQTTIQHFQPQQFLELYEGDEIPVGANIIGILKGQFWSTLQDRPILIGAHWDTVSFTGGTDDNGSGVAAMLEIARSLSQSSCSPNYSIIFVAFDFEETGSQGSLTFIKDYLVTEILKSAGSSKGSDLARFQGAFILDTIMNFNDSEKSQIFPSDWRLVLPDIDEELANENYRGNFLSMIYRKSVDHRLAHTFRSYWNGNLQNTQFKVKSLGLSLEADLPDIQVLSHHLNFLRSDHSRFWYMNDTEVPGTLQAVLLTDTGPYRGDMQECYHNVCDGPEVSLFNNSLNLQFLTKTTETLVDSLWELSGCDASNEVLRVSRGRWRGQGHRSSGSRRHRSPFYTLARWANQLMSKRM